jgi:hypothetical protein
VTIDRRGKNVLAFKNYEQRFANEQASDDENDYDSGVLKRQIELKSRYLKIKSVYQRTSDIFDALK